MAKKVCVIPSFLASAVSLSLAFSSSVRKTMKLPMRLSLFLRVAASIFLTKLVKGALASRAKIIATGLEPNRQMKQDFSPAPGPVKCSGSKTPGLSPTCGPDLSASAAMLVVAMTTASAPNAKTFLIVKIPFCEDRGTDHEAYLYVILDVLGRRFIRGM